MLSSQQMRAARGYLDWTRADLAARAKINVGTIKNIEDGAVQPYAETTEAIERVFRQQNLEFLANGGVCPRDNTLRVIDEGDPYLQLLDDVFATLNDTPRAEVLFCFVHNELSSAAVIESDLRLRRMGIRFRSLIEEGDRFMLYPPREYRCLPSRFFHNNTQVIYGGKFATMILDPETGKDTSAIIISNPHMAAVQRKLFNALWEQGSKPAGKSTAPRTYD